MIAFYYCQGLLILPITRNIFAEHNFYYLTIYNREKWPVQCSSKISSDKNNKGDKSSRD